MISLRKKCSGILYTACVQLDIVHGTTGDKRAKTRPFACRASVGRPSRARRGHRSARGGRTRSQQ